MITYDTGSMLRVMCVAPAACRALLPARAASRAARPSESCSTRRENSSRCAFSSNDDSEPSRALCLSLLLPLPLRSFQLKGSVLLTVWPQMAVCAGIAVFATIWRAYVGSEDFIIKDVKGHATLGTALAFLNVFRSNLSYGRYWDGRGQLGTLVKSGRELMRLVVTYSKVPEDPDEEAVRVPLLLLLLSRQRPRDARACARLADSPLRRAARSQKMEECLRDIWRLINCLMHSIVLAVQVRAAPRALSLACSHTASRPRADHCDACCAGESRTSRGIFRSRRTILM
jgi:hypothetical protein